MTYFFIHNQVLTENGVETEENYKSPEYLTQGEAERESLIFWNDRRKIDWSRIDRETSILTLYTKENGIEREIAPFVLKGTCSVVRP